MYIYIYAYLYVSIYVQLLGALWWALVEFAVPSTVIAVINWSQISFHG